MSRTTIEVLDQDQWNWVKNIRNRYELTSVSNVIFRIIKNSRELDVNKILFLKNLEKLFEYHYFGLKDFSRSMDLKINIIMKMVTKYFGPNFMIFDNNNIILKNKEKIHKKMIETGILPRELRIAYNLKTYIKKSNFNIGKYHNSEKNGIKIGIDNKDIIEILFPDPYERQMEIYNYLIFFVQNFFEKQDIKDIPCHDCEDTNCPMKKPDFIYFKSGISIELEDIEGDLVFDIIKNEGKLENKDDILACYGAFLAISIDLLIRDNLNLIDVFIKDEIYFNDNEKELSKILKILKDESIAAVFHTIEKTKDKEKFRNLYKNTFKNRSLEIKT